MRRAASSTESGVPGRTHSDLSRAVPALDLAIALWVIRRCSHVRHAADPDELLEVPSYKLRTIVADDPGMDVKVPLASTLNDRFDVGLSHVGSDLPVHDGTAEAVEQAA